MTTNLVKLINLILKKSKKISIGELVKSIYLRCNALFNKRGREVTSMLAYDQVYTQVLNEVIEDARRKENAHTIFEFDRRNTWFLVQETTNPREVWFA